MATATGRKTKAKNPGQLQLAGGAKKPAAKRNTAAAKKTNGRKPVRRRNPSPGTNLLLFSVGGVIAIKGFDLLIRYVLPTLAAPITIIGLGGAAFALSSWGGKYLGKWADIGAVGLGIFAVLRAYDEWVEPRLPASLQVGASGPLQVVQQAPLVSQANPAQQLGTRMYLNNGSYVDAYDTDAMAMAA
jgi:hypothetical protein